MKKLMAAAALLGAVACAHADPSESYSGFQNIHFGVVDGNPNDDTVASYQILGTRVVAQLGTGPVGATSPDLTTNMSFAGLASSSSSTLMGDGAQASFAIGSDSIMTSGSSGAAGSFYSTVTMFFDIFISAGSQLLVGGDIVRGMAADRNTTGTPLDYTPRLAGIDTSLAYSFGSPAFGDGGAFMKWWLNADIASAPGPIGGDDSRWEFDQSYSFEILGYGGGAFGRTVTVAFTTGALGSSYIAPAIPEPSTYVLMALGMATLIISSRRRKS